MEGNWGNLAESLRSLHLSGNSITEINFSHDEKKNASSSSSGQNGYQQQIKLFSKLRKLVWLDLSSNRISHINLNNLPKSLVTIDLSKNILTNLPIGLLEHLHDLKILSLKDNLISKITNLELINSNVNIYLEKLDLGKNLIEEITPNLFNISSSNSIINIKAINFDKNFIRIIPENVFYNLNTIHMVLAFNYIEQLDDNAFATLENSLEYLDLERNQLNHLPAAIIKLNRLRYLYMTSNFMNNIYNLPTTLKVLSLSGNNFSAIPVDALSNCTELSYLNMGYNKVSELPENVFMVWGQQLQTLLLRNNKITRLNYGIFNGLEQIKEISLSFNDIHYVHPNVFENISKTLKILELSFGIYREDYPLEALSYLSELMWLGLDNNNLKLIPENSLSTLQQLTYINLSFNRITILSKNIFIPEIHKNLIEIDLSYNIIEKVTSNTFDNLELLQIINLSSNKLKTLEKYSFYDLPLLSYIDLSYNALNNISENSFSFLPNLLSLDLMYNNLHQFSFKSFKHVSNLTTPIKLNISNNYINLIDGELNSYLYIFSLDVSNNQLTDPQVFKNLGYSLRVLYLNDNNLSFLNNHAFGDLQLLEILNLSKNNLTTLRRRCFQGLNNLQELDIGHNRIDILQVEQFSNLKKLRVLKMNNNRLKALPRDVFLNTRIESLDLSGNLIMSWPVNSFSDIGFTLRSIYLNNNNLEYLDSTMFLNTQFLLELNLSFNQIKILPDNTFSHLNNLTKIDLSMNPLITTNFKELLLNIPRLREINLKATGLFNIPKLILKYLTKLDVSGNYINEIESLSDLRYLHTLKISDNKITNLTNLCKNLPQSVRVLDVSRNPIRKISLHDFTQIRRLEELSIEDIKISNQDAFVKLHNLKRLRISSQQNFSEIVSKIRGLQELRISVYEKTIDDHFFSKMLSNTKLTLVELSGNRLLSITNNAFFGLSRNTNLKISLRNTLINDLPPGLFYPLKYIPKLTIDLSDNLIAALSPDSFYPNASSWDAVGTRSVVGGLDISGNPLQCECGLVWLGHWLRRWLRETTQINLINKDEMKQMLLVSPQI